MTEMHPQDIVYVDLTEEGAYIVSTYKKQYIKPGWMAAPLAFVGLIYTQNRKLLFRGGKLHLELPPGAEVQTSFGVEEAAERKRLDAHFKNLREAKQAEAGA